LNKKEYTMDTLIVYLDDADYAQHMLAPMLNKDISTRWVLVACAPRMSHRISKWLSNGAREKWRTQWSERLFAKVMPMVAPLGKKTGSSEQALVECVVAKGPLLALTQSLRLRFGAAHVVDARRPKFGHALEPVTVEQPLEKQGWQVPGAVGSLSALLVLASD
jgi:hypothetical protein